MKRSGFKKKTDESLKECRQCGKSFIPFQSAQVVCSPVCAYRYVNTKKKEEIARTRERKQALKPIGQIEGECRRIVQKIARIRDRNDGCISCHMGPDYQGQWHGSHFRSHGGCSSLQFHLWNIHKSCAQCNRHKSGNIAEYRPRLVEKIGQERVDWLDMQPKSKRFDREYLYRFKMVMLKKLRRMERRYSNGS